ncbi:MAG: ATP-binding cassette domain-containing protein, partial [Phycisphaeraceae bacterium]|nr:ATP-binding cassette domain-containing protein [Phycisphaeraceae bacterium]
REELEWARLSHDQRREQAARRLSAYDSLYREHERGGDGRDELFIPGGPHLGNQVVSAKGLTHRYGDRTLFADLDFDVPPGAIVGLIGPNGSGKSTLLQMIAGETEPDDGNVDLGPTVELAWARQERNTLDPDQTAWETISGGADKIRLGSREVNSRAYLARFGFRGSDQQKRAGDLSGGERNRLYLALTLKQSANLLLLDEPTNDLDLTTTRTLEHALAHFAGSVMVTSHDRWFLDRLATHILAFDGAGHVQWFEGNYSAWEQAHGADAGGDQARHRKLKR